MKIIVAIEEFTKAEIGLGVANNSDCAGKIRFQ